MFVVCRNHHCHLPSSLARVSVGWVRPKVRDETGFSSRGRRLLPMNVPPFLNPGVILLCLLALVAPARAQDPAGKPLQITAQNTVLLDASNDAAAMLQY